MTPDDIEKLAREALANDDGYEAANYHDNALVLMHRKPTRDLARALLAVLPVVRAAVEWRERGPGQSHCDEEDCPCTSATCRLKNAVDQMRREMEGL